LGQKTSTFLASVVRGCGREGLVSDPVYDYAVVLKRNTHTSQQSGCDVGELTSLLLVKGKVGAVRTCGWSWHSSEYS